MAAQLNFEQLIAQVDYAIWLASPDYAGQQHGALFEPVKPLDEALLHAFLQKRIQARKQRARKRLRSSDFDGLHPRNIIPYNSPHSGHVTRSCARKY